MQDTMSQHRSNSVMSNNSPNSESSGTNLMLFHQSKDCCRWTVGESMLPKVPSNTTGMNSTFNLHFRLADMPTEATLQKKFLAFDKSGDQSSLILSSLSPSDWNLNDIGIHNPLASSDFYIGMTTKNDLIEQTGETNAFNSDGSDNVHEDTAEIDALLSSDSENDEENSSDHFPLQLSLCDGVSSSTVLVKQKRLDEQIDLALRDTASSAARFYNWEVAEDIDVLSKVKGCSCPVIRDEREISKTSGPNKRSKRDQIRETMSILRCIVPGGKGQDTIVVLDKAINHLRSLKTQTGN